MEGIKLIFEMTKFPFLLLQDWALTKLNIHPFIIIIIYFFFFVQNVDK